MVDKSKGSSIITIMIVCTIVILVIAGGIYFYQFHKTVTPKTTTTIPNVITDMKSKWGYLKNGAKGNCLVIAGLGEPNDNVEIGNCTGEDNQLWRLSDTYALMHYPDKLCLDPAGFDAAKGVNVGIYTCDQGSNPGNDETWTIDLNPMDKTKIRFINQKSGLCLDMVGTTGDSGSNVLIGDCTGTPNQWYTFVPSPKNLV